MKKIIIKTVLGVALVFSLQLAAKAQLSVNINIGSQPAWGPAGYNHVDYYYLPDIESYYNVATGQYIYLDGGRWIYSRALPPRYAGYDLYSGYKVVVNRPNPYLNFNRDRVTYANYRNWHGNRQPLLRESRNINNRTVINNTTNVRVNRPGNNGNHFGNGNNGGNYGGNNGNHFGNGNNGGNNGRGNMGGNQQNGRQGFNDRGRGNPHDNRGGDDRGRGDDRGHH